jgi:hypothetical protein
MVWPYLRCRLACQGFATPIIPHDGIMYHIHNQCRISVITGSPFETLTRVALRHCPTVRALHEATHHFPVTRGYGYPPQWTTRCVQT